MADREIRFAIRVRGADSTDVTFTDVNDAKTKIEFNNLWDWTIGAPGFTLEDSDKRLVITWVFDESQEDEMRFVNDKVRITRWQFNSTQSYFESAECNYKVGGQIITS